MKNLKRALSFALATVMLIGMMVMGVSAADFGDADEIVNTDAVNTLYALGIVDGKDDGNYDPTGIVTRAEMAKLICVALNGGKAPVLGTKAEPTYTDIKGHWAESYIEYCASLGIVSGRGDGTFDPGATVTGNEAAKMMLVAMGWDSTIFNFTGANWAINVGVEANKVKLFEDLETIDPSLGLTRDNTAQLVYNGILAPIMEKSPNMSVTSGNISWDYTLMDGTYGDKKTIFSTKFDGQIWIGSFDGNAETLALKDGYIRVTGDLDTADTSANNYTPTAAEFSSDFDIAYVGEEVKVLFKDGKAGIANRPDGKDTIYGVYTTGATEVVNATVGDISTTYVTTGKIKVDGTEYKVADATTTPVVAIVRNYGAKDDVKVDSDGTPQINLAAANPLFTTYKAAFEALAAQKGDSVKFILKDGKIVKAYLVESTLATVTAVNSEKVTVSSIGALKIADHEIYEGVAKNDVVVVTKLYPTANTTYVVEPAEVVSGTVDSFKTTTTPSLAYNNVALDGTTYKIWNKAAMPASVGGDTGTTAFAAADIGETYDLYLVNGYVAGAVKTSETASNYSIIIDKNTGTAGSNFSPLKVVALGADGVKTTLTVDKNGATTLAIGDIITWTGTEAKAKIAVEKAWSAAALATPKLYDKSTKAVSGKPTTVDAVLFAEVTGNPATTVDGNGNTIVNPSASFKAYSIRSLGDIAATNYTAVVKSGKVVAAYADLNTKPAGATDTTVYGIVSAWKGVVEIDNTHYSVYTIENDTTTYTVNVEAGSLSTGYVYGFEPTKDSLYATGAGNPGDAFTLATSLGTAVYVKEFNETDGTISYYTGVKAYNSADQEVALNANNIAYYKGDDTTLTVNALDDDLAIIYVNSDDEVAGEQVGVNAFDTIKGYKNAIIIEDASHVVTHIIVESSCEASIK